MILALNTAQAVHEMALIDGDRLLIEESWTDPKNNVEELVPRLQKMLSQLDLSKKDITDVVVVRGPGSFTAVRTGVVFANALAEGLGARLYALDTFELFKHKAAILDPLLVVLTAGGLDVAVWDGKEVKVGPIAVLLADHSHDSSVNIVAELKEAQNDELKSIIQEKKWKRLEAHELQTLGEALLTFGLDGLEPIDTAQPYYLKAPTITKSSNPWKQ